MLQRPEGATIAEIVEATGWQPHTVRGALAGALKKRLGPDDRLREDRGPRAGLPSPALNQRRIMATWTRAATDLQTTP